MNMKQLSPFIHLDHEGPFDIIGDLHGCLEELEALLHKLGYVLGRHPQGRTLVFLGDLTDRGPQSLSCYELVCGLVHHHGALAVSGNHDDKLKRYLAGRPIQIRGGLETTVQELQTKPSLYKARLHDFLASLPTHYLLDSGRLVVAHAGLSEQLQGKTSERARVFCLYGSTNGRFDDQGFPVRLDWAQSYQGEAAVVYGHTPIVTPAWVHNTINIDTGCVFGGKLTALRYPERELVSVPALKAYDPSRQLF